MRIALINGSPKVNSSASGSLLADLKGYFGEKAEIAEFGFHRTSISQDKVGELAKAEAWVFAYQSSPFLCVNSLSVI